jgi:hypothetical protein
MSSATIGQTEGHIHGAEDRMLKRLVAGTVAAAALLLLVAVPSDAQYPLPTSLVSSDGGSCTPGAPVTLTVQGAAPGTDVTFIFQPDAVVIGVATADANGTAVLQTTWPVNASAGLHTVVAQGVDGDPNNPMTLDLSIEVTCAPGAAGALARTGSDTLPWVRIGVVLVALGGILLLTTRKRHAVVRETV